MFVWENELEEKIYDDLKLVVMREQETDGGFGFLMKQVCSLSYSICMRRKQLGISSLIALCCYQWIVIGVQHHHVNIVSNISFKELVLRLIKEGWRCGFQWCGVCGYIEIR